MPTISFKMNVRITIDTFTESFKTVLDILASRSYLIPFNENTLATCTKDTAFQYCSRHHPADPPGCPQQLPEQDIYIVKVVFMKEKKDTQRPGKKY